MCATVHLYEGVRVCVDICRYVCLYTCVYMHSVCVTSVHVYRTCVLYVNVLVDNSVSGCGITVCC